MGDLLERSTLGGVTDETTGQEALRRRKALGIHSLRDAERILKVGRATIQKIEDDDATVSPISMDRLFAALDRLERKASTDQPELGLNEVLLPDGSRVTFRDSAEYVAEASARFLRERNL